MDPKHPPRTPVQEPLSDPVEATFTGGLDSSHSLSNYAGTSPVLQQQGNHDGTQLDDDFSMFQFIPSSTVLSVLSPENQRMVRAQLEARGMLTMNMVAPQPHQSSSASNSTQHSSSFPNAMQPSHALPRTMHQKQQQPSPGPPLMEPSPAPPLPFQAVPLRSFGAELNTTTNIPMSGLKRPVQSLATDQLEHSPTEPPVKKMRRTSTNGKDAARGESDDVDRVNDKTSGVEEDPKQNKECDNAPFTFPPAPFNVPVGGGEEKLAKNLEPVTCEEKRKVIAEFLATQPNKDFSSETEYRSRIRECKTLGRMLTGSWHGITGGGDVKWYLHPVHHFNMWLRIDSDRTETLWTINGDSVKMNVYQQLFPKPAMNLYQDLFDDGELLKRTMKQNKSLDLGDPRTNKKAFKSALFRSVAVSRGNGQFGELVDEFWDSKERKAVHKKHSDAKKEKQSLQQQQQQPTINVAAGASASILSPGAIASGASASIFSPGAIASGASNIIVSAGATINYHHHSSPATAQAPPQPPSDQPGSFSV